MAQPIKPSKPLNLYLPNASKLVYGCMGLGGNWDQNPVNADNINQCHQVIDTALEIDINVFDHADIYTFGKAEQAFGEALSQRPELRESIYLQSKCGIRFADNEGPKRYDFSAEWISNSVDNILSRLKTDYLDVLMLHRPDPLMELDEVASTLQTLKASGKVRHFGVSNMHAQQIAYLQSALDAPLITNQLELSLAKLDWINSGVMVGSGSKQTIDFTAGTMEYCQQNNMQIQAWGCMAQGLFSGRNIDDQPESIKQTAAKVRQLSAQYNASTEAIVLAWLMRHPANIQPVIGTTHLDRIKACGQAPHVQLSRVDWYSLYESAYGNELP